MFAATLARKISPLGGLVALLGRNDREEKKFFQFMLNFTLYILHLDETRSTSRLAVPVRRSAQGDREESGAARSLIRSS